MKCKDHVRIRIGDGRQTTDITVALSDASRYAFLALTGANCHISDIRIDKEVNPVPDGFIPRIADEISYINGPEGDLPNVQIDSTRSDSTAGVPVTDGLKLSFHTMSLPTARLIWHCPYIVLFTSADGKVNGEGYREYALVRLNGEDWETGGIVPNRTTVVREDSFGGWDAWKKGNKEGYDCTVAFAREGNRITVTTSNLGLSVKNVTTLSDRLLGEGTVYAALTGDQCALTNIRISRK